jgi:teichuronic acid exporter
VHSCPVDFRLLQPADTDTGDASIIVDHRNQFFRSNSERDDYQANQLQNSDQGKFDSWCNFRNHRDYSGRQWFRCLELGSRVLASGLISTIFDNIYLLAIGKLFSAAELGFFTRAKQFGEFPSLQLTWMVGRVSFPVFSSIKDEPVRLKRGLKKALTTLVLVNFPMMIGIMVIARPLVIALLTEKWAPCIPYLQLLCLVCLLFPLNWLNINVLLAMGRSDLSLRLEVIKRILIVFNIALTWWWGIKAMLCGQIVISIISYCLNSYYNGVLANYPVKEQLHDLSSYLITAIFMGLVVYGIGWLMFSNVWFLLFVQVTAGLFIYVGLCWLFRLPAFLEMWRMGSRKLQLLTTSVA